MADILIKHLKQKGAEHSALALLVNQWGFDEQLIPKSLQAVGNLFPHYSRHDESHSKQILVNIERLLGENIELLTATDTWLLLEAAYWHDIGMVVPRKDLDEAISEPEFERYLRKINDDPRHELNQFSKTFLSGDDLNVFGGATSPIDAVDKFRQLMAEWFRQKHASRAGEIIRTPWTTIGLSSPRTELIPARLFRVLGRICEMHGEPFEKLMSSTGLPFRETGLAQEDCHPRFVACLLRMGDLLDLDDNRFCPVMQRISGEGRPQLSYAHEDKHAGIRHLRIDQERIEISAECQTIEGYLETFKWFDWLKKEVQNQMANWQEIAPSRALGLLPTLGGIEVRLGGQLQILREGVRPQFGLDSRKAVELLQGSNLYSSRFASIRELLQNAIDASLLRLWVEDKSKSKTENWSNPELDSVKSTFKSMSINVELQELHEAGDLPTGQSRWNLSITDQGTGISQADLLHMLQIGGSHSNPERRQRIAGMPEWMKPSGEFGIGFQSAFMISDEVRVTTKSVFSNEVLEIKMYSPTGQKDGLVLVKKLPYDVGSAFGTKVELSLSLEKFASSYSISMGENENQYSSEFAVSMDPVLDESFPFEAGQIFDQIKAFSERSLLPIAARLVTSKKAYDIAPTRSSDHGLTYVKTPAGDQLSISYTPHRFSTPHHNSIYYRGQPFKTESLYLPFVKVNVDIMSGHAGSWLKANRDQIKPGAEESLEKMIVSALELKVRSDLSSACPESPFRSQRRGEYGLFIESMSLVYGAGWKTLANDVSGAWLQLPCDKRMTFAEYFQKDEWTVAEEADDNSPPVRGCDLTVLRSWPISILTVLLNEWIKDDNRTVQVLAGELEKEDLRPVADENTPAGMMGKHFNNIAKYRLRYRLKNGPQPRYSDEALASCLIEKMLQPRGNRRFLLDALPGWEKLILREGEPVRASYLFPVRAPKELILLPFLYKSGHIFGNRSIECTDDQLAALSRWAQPRLVATLSVVEVSELYAKLIDHIDNEKMRSSDHWDTWKKLRNLP